MSLRDNKLITAAVLELARRMPPGWSATDKRQSRRPREGVLEVSIRPPAGRGTKLRLLPRHELSPRQVQGLLRELEEVPSPLPVLIVSPYLTQTVRELLAEAEVSHLDLTGNIWIALSDPGLCIQCTGATRRPGRRDRPARSLRGAKAGRIVRYLCDFREPHGVREIASQVGTDPGYVSRVLSFLDSQALVDRGSRKEVVTCHWQKLLMRWSEDAPLETRGEQQWLLAPRGPTALRERLTRWQRPYVVSGSLAAHGVAPVVDLRTVLLYVRDAEEAMAQLDLREVSSGANVHLVEITDDLVFQRSREQEGLRMAAWSQDAADLLASGDRGPREAEALMEWMENHEEAWRE